jgi:hypothetical protein
MAPLYAGSRRAGPSNTQLGLVVGAHCRVFFALQIYDQRRLAGGSANGALFCIGEVVETIGTAWYVAAVKSYRALVC